MTRHPLAVQLYTLRNEIAANYPQTLRAVAELGYRAVELAGFGTLTPAELRAELDAQGLVVAGMHTGLDDLEQRLDAALDAALTLGTHYVVCPYLPQQRRESAEAYRQVAARLEQIGRACQTRGLQLCYHHHDFELAAIDGTTGFDILVNETDVAVVQFEIDVYWAAFAGVDPVGLLQRLAGRVPLVHLKDMAGDGTRTFAEVGHGTLAMPAILAAAEQAGTEWLIVEQDACRRPPLESIALSLEYLRGQGLS